MRAFLLPLLGAITLTAVPQMTPDVAYFVWSAPGRPFSEDVVTQPSRNLHVTVVRIPQDAIADSNASEYPRPMETLDPRGVPVFHGDFRERITLPPLAAGLYEVRLNDGAHSAIQRLDVGTLALLTDFMRRSKPTVPLRRRWGNSSQPLPTGP